MTNFSHAIERAYRAGDLTRLHVHILYALQRLAAERPTHKRLAAVAGCHPSSVKRALARAHALGLICWDRHVVASIGWRAQTANIYRLEPGPIGYTSTFSRSTRLVPSADLEAVRLRREAHLAAIWGARASRTSSIPSANGD